MLLLYHAVPTTFKARECEAIVGKEVWANMEHHTFYENGLFGELGCGFGLPDTAEKQRNVHTLNCRNESITFPIVG